MARIISLLPLRAVALTLITILATSPFFVNADEKIKPEELIIRHLEAIGPKEKLVINRIISGNCKFNSRLRQNNSAQGPVVLASDGDKCLIGMGFGLREYPHEKIGFNGEDVTTSYIQPGVRSVLGNFVLTHRAIFKEGLFGGSLSTAWPLLDLAKKKAKLDYNGVKKVDGKEVHQVTYNPKGGSDLKIQLFFDKESFRHVQTRYDRSIAASMGASVDQSASQRETRFTLTEKYEDFKEENGLMLPHTFKLQLVIMGERETGQFDWVIELNKFEFNQQLNTNAFQISQETR